MRDRPRPSASLPPLSGAASLDGIMHAVAEQSPRLKEGGRRVRAHRGLSELAQGLSLGSADGACARERGPRRRWAFEIRRAGRTFYADDSETNDLRAAFAGRALRHREGRPKVAPLQSALIHSRRPMAVGGSRRPGCRPPYARTAGERRISSGPVRITSPRRCFHYTHRRDPASRDPRDG